MSMPCLLSRRPMSIFLLLLLALSQPLLAATASQGVALPETKAGQLIGAWAELCRKPDLAQMTKWMEAHLSADSAKRMPARARAEFDFELCRDNGGLVAVAVAGSEPNSTTLTLQGVKTGAWFEMLFITNDAGELDRNGTRASIPVESSLPKTIDDAVIAAEVKRIVGTASAAGQFSGIVVVARGNRIVAQASGGYADRAAKTPVTVDSRFTIGSMGKMFTAVAIAQLADANKLRLDDTVGHFFPEYPNRTVRDKVTVSMLLSHRAGLGDFLDKRTPKMMAEGVRRAAEFMPLYDKDEPQFAPGTGSDYSNAGLALAGAIVEQVSGEDYPDYLRRHVFAPGGMDRSDPNTVPGHMDGLVTPYTRDGAGPWHPAGADLGSPAGGAISTAADLVRFAEALRNGTLVSHERFLEMMQPRTRISPTTGYGYAMEIMDIYGQTVVGHGGGYPGVSTHLYLVSGSPYTVVVLANQDPPAEAYGGLPVVALVAEMAKRSQ